MIISSINKLPTVIKIQSLSEIYNYTVSDLLMTEKKCPSTYIAKFKWSKTTCKLTSTTTSWHLYFLAMFNLLSEPSIILRYLDKILEKEHSINIYHFLRLMWCSSQRLAIYMAYHNCSIFIQFSCQPLCWMLILTHSFQI